MSVVPDAVEVQAFIRNSTIDATGDVTLDAHGTETISALTVAGSVAIAAGGGTSVGATAAGVYTENRVRSHIRAYIDGDGEGPEDDADTTDTLTAANLLLNASDNAQIEANAAAVSVGAAIGSNAVAVSIGISVAYNEIGNDVEAYIANVDGAEIGGDVVIDARSLPTGNVTEDYDTGDGQLELKEGDVVKVLGGHSAGGEEGRYYRYRGYADYLSTDGGQVDDGSTTDTDEGYELHLVAGDLVLDVSSGITYKLTADHDEDDPLVVGETQTVADIPCGESRQVRGLHGRPRQRGLHRHEVLGDRRRLHPGAQRSGLAGFRCGQHQYRGERCRCSRTQRDRVGYGRTSPAAPRTTSEATSTSTR
ncbi:MAG: hypothetical protein M5U09_14700 [Gammaproteobacteria bacterium]|nr:hypothetical protein [Gammaproteobacteria bacterium]